MKILDRYIARLYLTNIVTLLVVLACFIVTIDFSLNVDRFVRRAREVAGVSPEDPSHLRVGLVTVLLIADLWWPRLLQLFNFLNGLVLTGAMGFTLSQLVRHRELVAVLASGQSLYRVARPVVLVALGMIGLQALNQELVIPRLAPLLTRDQGDAGRHSLGSAHVSLARDASGRVWYAADFDADAGVLRDLYVWEREADGTPLARLTASSATYRDGGWDLTDGRRESRTGTGVTPQATARIETNLDPIQLRARRFAGYNNALSWHQISEMLRAFQDVDPDSARTRADRDRLERMRWGRVSMTLASVLSLLITIPFFLTKIPGGLVVRALKCAPVAVVTLMGGVLGASAPVPGVPAALGVFLPVLVLVPIAIASLASVKT